MLIKVLTTLVCMVTLVIILVYIEFNLIYQNSFIFKYFIRAQPHFNVILHFHNHFTKELRLINISAAVIVFRVSITVLQGIIGIMNSFNMYVSSIHIYTRYIYVYVQLCSCMAFPDIVFISIYGKVNTFIVIIWYGKLIMVNKTLYCHVR